MDKTSEALNPIYSAALFPKLEGMLIDLLRSLAPEDWEKQTVAPKWKVKEVAAHLLDTQLRKLSAGRDGYSGESVCVTSHAELVAFINRLNSEGVRVYRRLSPEVLIALMHMASAQLCAYVASLDPLAPAKIGVSWAGEETSTNWFDTAREFTERWHHQEQIRLAVHQPGIMTREFYYPVLDCFMRALPFAYRTVVGRPGALAQFHISGDCGGSWLLLRESERWRLVDSGNGEKMSETTIPQEIAWRIFTKGIDRESARAQVHVSGDREIGLHILGMVSIVG